MLPHILRYFRPEKEAGLYILIIGSVIILASAILWWSRNRYRAMAIPLGVIALIEVSVGGYLYLRTDHQIESLTERYYIDREDYAIAETARMEKVMAAFQIYKAIEIAMIVGGLALAVVFRKRPSYVGVALGLVVQGAIMLGFDIVASQRAQLYLDALRRIA
jgi:hypothetical protein